MEYISNVQNEGENDIFKYDSTNNPTNIGDIVSDYFDGFSSDDQQEKILIDAVNGEKQFVYSNSNLFETQYSIKTNTGEFTYGDKLLDGDNLIDSIKYVDFSNPTVTFTMIDEDLSLKGLEIVKIQDDKRLINLELTDKDGDDYFDAIKVKHNDGSISEYSSSDDNGNYDVFRSTDAQKQVNLMNYNDADGVFYLNGPAISRNEQLNVLNTDGSMRTLSEVMSEVGPIVETDSQVSRTYTSAELEEAIGGNVAIENWFKELLSILPFKK